MLRYRSQVVDCLLGSVMRFLALRQGCMSRLRAKGAVGCVGLVGSVAMKASRRAIMLLRAAIRV